MRAYAISDIHGCAETFESLLSKIKINKTDKLYLLGDYIDKGPDSKGVVDTTLGLVKLGLDVVCLKGNREDGFQTKKGSKEWKNWVSQGGKETLESFGIECFADLPKKYKKFFSNLTYYESYKDFWLVHAGFDFRLKKPFKDFESMMLIRSMTYNEKKAKGKRIVHGHTPQKLKDLLKDYKKDNRIVNIDSGCVYKNKSGMGYLIAFELNSNAFFIQENVDTY